jgi:AcrR family transcriptional regulator
MSELGLRETKKRETRQHISDTATRMFIEYGFDHVRVSDVAEKCGVSEKTVFNYFPTKESLVLDQVDPMIERLRERLGPGAEDAPTDAMTDLVDETVEMLIKNGLGQSEMEPLMHKFMAMVNSTPALTAARDAATKRLIDTAVETLAARYDRETDDAEIRVIAIALVGFWDAGRIRAVHHARAGKSPTEIRTLTRKDMAKAAKLIHNGLDGAFMGGTPKPRKSSRTK